MNNESNTDIIKQITSCFHQSFLPKMAMLDGKWGTGKSYFIEGDIKIDLESLFSNGSFKISLFGIKNISEFKDTLISSYYYSSKERKELLSSLLNTTLKTASKAESKEANMISMIFSGMSSITKSIMLSKIKNTCFIIDDIERVDIKLLHGIFGEAHNITINNKNNIGFLFIGNNSRKNFLNENTEKLFTEIIDFVPVEPVFIKKTLNKKLLENSEIYENIIITFNDLGEKNLRILIRSINLLNQLCEKYQRDSSAIEFVKNIYPIILSFTIGRYIYNTKYTEFELLQSYCETNNRLSFAVKTQKANMNNSDKPLPYDKIKSKISEHLNKVSDRNLIKFCYGYFVEDDDLKIAIDKIIPNDDSSIDYLLKSYTSSEAIFKQCINKLEFNIFQKTETTITNWFYYVSIYMNFSDLGYVHKIENSRIITILNMKKINKDNEELDYHINKKKAEIKKNPFLTAVYNKQLSILKDNEHSEKLIKINKNINEKWDQVFNDIIYQDYIKENFFSYFKDTIISGINNNWKPENIILFSHFLQDIHENNFKLTKDEMINIYEISESVKSLYHHQDIGMKKGALHLTSKALDDLVSDL